MVSITSGLAAGTVCNFIANWRARTALDDSLDALASHGVGGMLGTFATDLFASAAINSAGPNELLYGYS
jgi:Amt family ammonium transporter